MTKYVQINKTTLLIIIVALLAVTTGALYMNNTVQGVSDKPKQTEQQAEAFHNLRFNDTDSCQGKTNLIINPLQYNFNSKPYTLKFPYFNYYNSPEIIGCSGRRIPCDKRSAIPNVLDPIDISNRNIAPVSVRVDGNLDMELRKVGTIYKIFGNENQVHPLYGRMLYRNDSKWEYFTRMGQTLEYLRVFQQRQYEELGNNDQVEIEGQCGKYRVTIYDRFMPQYMPFI